MMTCLVVMCHVMHKDCFVMAFVFYAPKRGFQLSIIVAMMGGGRLHTTVSLK